MRSASGNSPSPVVAGSFGFKLVVELPSKTEVKDGQTKRAD